MISEEEVQHIAQLARLGLSQKELAKMQKEIAGILKFFAKLKEVDVSDVRAVSHLNFFNVLRKDAVGKPKPELASKLFESAPNKEKGYVKVKAVLK